MSSPSFWGRHVFPVFLEMLGKTLGDVGEDRNIGEDTQGCQEGHQGGGDDIGEVWEVGEDLGDNREDIGQVGEDIGDNRDFGEDMSSRLPWHFGEDMSSLSSFRCRGRHVSPIFA